MCASMTPILPSTLETNGGDQISIYEVVFDYNVMQAPQWIILSGMKTYLVISMITSNMSSQCLSCWPKWLRFDFIRWDFESLDFMFLIDDFPHAYLFIVLQYGRYFLWVSMWNIVSSCFNESIFGCLDIWMDILFLENLLTNESWLIILFYRLKIFYLAYLDLSSSLMSSWFFLLRLLLRLCSMAFTLLWFCLMNFHPFSLTWLNWNIIKLVFRCDVVLARA
jgi:hypothetical protein